ncbi:hypothetical protein FKG94_15380 [Exilibacterium tricleocarpae]|uniref:Transcription factor zinc-finger domain-containing protein n=1 Tax=Exilibacterium tricleocarpae TaxID=2591008 RepID=A0A545TFJ8_9GAMM|nr:hypothetical protein [Exilibacterium tricleocarpae]TQV75990.1 hypothetical protein FKG94_15380 [Exilibacterium tricleocarpae]
MNCPQCKGYRLAPRELEPGLIAAGCSKCEGVLISLLNYRYWADYKRFSGPDGDEEIIAEDNEKAQLCPKCHRIMAKYRIGIEASNKIDLCANCDEAWLDSGEWSLLKRLDLQDKLPKIFTDAWQANIRKLRQTQQQKARYQNILGDDFERVEEFKSWLEAHVEADKIKQYLLY